MQNYRQTRACRSRGSGRTVVEQEEVQVPWQLLFREELQLVIVGALIFVASFAWRDFFSDVKDKIAPRHAGLLGRFVFTVVETVILVFLIISVERLFASSSSPRQHRHFEDTQAEEPSD